MPRRKSDVPAKTLHKATGQARVRIDGRDIYLGRFGSPEADEKYRRLVAEFLTTGSPPQPSRPVGTPEPGRSVAELLLAFWTHATAYYVKGGLPTGEIAALRDALRPLRELYGSTPVADFGPLKLKALREAMVRRGWCRTLVNARVRRVKLTFKWGVENELVPPHVHHGLSAVAGLRRGRTDARESSPVAPVADADVNAALPHLNRQVAAMVKLQAFTGMRPGEVCGLRPCDLDRDGEVWTFRPREAQDRTPRPEAGRLPRPAGAAGARAVPRRSPRRLAVLLPGRSRGRTARRPAGRPQDPGELRQPAGDEPPPRTPSSARSGLHDELLRAGDPRGLPEGRGRAVESEPAAALGRLGDPQRLRPGSRAGQSRPRLGGHDADLRRTRPRTRAARRRGDRVNG